MSKALSFCVLTVALYFSIVASQSCSEVKLIKECECRTDSSEVEIRCIGLSQPSQVQAALMASKDTAHLIVENSALPALPVDFGPHSLKKLSIVNTKMPFISSPQELTRSAFDGLKDLYRISLDGMTDINDWDWSKLKDLPNLTVLHIQGGTLVHIPKTFSMIGGSHLEELTLSKCKLTSIAEGGLAFPKLKVLQILDDPLEELNAAMFHPDNEMEMLILYGIPGVHLSEDIFSSMKNLKSLSVDSSILNAITGEHFIQKQIESFSLYPGETTPSCDCKYNWLLSHKNAYLGFCVDQTETELEFQEYLTKCPKH